MLSRTRRFDNERGVRDAGPGKPARAPPRQRTLTPLGAGQAPCTKKRLFVPHHHLHGHTLGRDQPSEGRAWPAFQGVSLPIPPFGEPPKTKDLARARTPLASPKEAKASDGTIRKIKIPPIANPGCRQPRLPALELSTTAGSRRRNSCPLNRTGQPPPGRATDPRKARLAVNEASAGTR